jgi:hypothetical protein
MRPGCSTTTQKKTPKTPNIPVMKFKVGDWEQLTIRAIMICFFDMNGIPHYEYIPQGQITKHSYFGALFVRNRKPVLENYRTVVMI